jgi:hypothetical protein
MHRIIAEELLGRPLREGEVIHHYGDGKKDNTKIVVCASRREHVLLHTRIKAYEATGFPNYRKCAICSQYDDPANMIHYESARSYRHKECMRKVGKQYRDRRKLERLLELQEAG